MNYRANNSKGYATVKRAYNEKLLLSEAYFDQNNQPVLSADGYASKKMQYDGNSDLIYQATYAPDGMLLLQSNKYAVILHPAKNFQRSE
ncbi:hypothetical protein AGMMS49992_21020 [Clostridia bacterium]|nr:hypothetical protein AGMMS49992_21020 [Clostridia bacterium]